MIRSTRTLTGATVAIFVLCLIVRIALIGTGADRERIPDTFMKDTLRAAEAVHAGHVGSFLLSDHKYPLLGSYLMLPAVFAHVAYQYTVHDATLQSFIRHYVLGESMLHIWVRIWMLLLHISGIGALMYAVWLATKNRKAVMSAFWFVALSYYATVFSVAPRIHALAFIAACYTVLAVVRYYHTPTTQNLLWLTGSVLLGFAVSQSAIVLFPVPFVAYYMRRTFGSAERVHRTFWLRAMVLVVFCVFISYPQVLNVFGSNEFSLRSAFLSPEHSQPKAAAAGLKALYTDSFAHTEFALSWILLVSFASYALRRTRFDTVETILLVPLPIFLLIFGLTSVSSGRFVLIVLPFLFAFAVYRLARVDFRPLYQIPVALLLLLQLVPIIGLFRLAVAGDTRTQAAAYLLRTTRQNDPILSSIDTSSLGITPTPSAAGQKTSPGLTDRLIAERGITGTYSRNIAYLHPEDPLLIDPSLYTVVVLHGGKIYDRYAPLLNSYSFTLEKSFLHAAPGRGTQPYFNWDVFSEKPIFYILRLRAAGPSIYVFRKLEPETINDSI